MYLVFSPEKIDYFSQSSSVRFWTEILSLFLKSTHFAENQIELNSQRNQIKILVSLVFCFYLIMLTPTDVKQQRMK